MEDVETVDTNNISVTTQEKYLLKLFTILFNNTKGSFKVEEQH